MKNKVKSLIDRLVGKRDGDVNEVDFNWLIGLTIVDVVRDESDYPYKYILELSDGHKIKVEVNEGCSGCMNGSTDVDDLRILIKRDNAITNVYHEEIEPRHDESDGCYKVFVFYALGDMSTFEYALNAGNGWYGSGFYLTLVD